MTFKFGYSTNLFDKSNSSNTVGGVLASNSRARVEQTDDGRIYVVIDGIKYSANKYDLFSMNDNPNAWLDAFVNAYDKEANKNELNSGYYSSIDKINDKIEENNKNIKESRSIQLNIKEAIKSANLALHNFLEQCGVNLRSSLTGEKRVYADKLNNDYWAQRFNLVSESNNEYRLLTENCSNTFDKGKLEQNIAFNNISLERINSSELS